MRILLIPLLFIVIGSFIVYMAGPSLKIPESIAEFQAWLQSFDNWAWAAGFALIAGDALLPLPSDPTTFTLGLIYGGLIGCVTASAAAFASLRNTFQLSPK